MCFAKSTPSIPKEDPVIQHEANASITKNSANNRLSSGFKQNIKTSAFGLEDVPNQNKKTLLGE